jgi:hypothetical protein
MAFNLTEAMNSVSAIIGVNPGYDGENFAVQDPAHAAQIVQDKLSQSTVKGRVFPGRVLYPRDRGCPVGGEVVGTVFSAPDQTNLLKEFNKIRQDLEQVTVSVVTTPDTGAQMKGFAVSFGPGNLLDVARLWQENAAALSAKSGFHVSGAVYQDDTGNIYGQAEANPTRISDLEMWERDAQDLVQTIKPGAQPHFRTVGYHYLRD